MKKINQLKCMEESFFQKKQIPAIDFTKHVLYIIQHKT